jgi:hypothetical protein
MRKAIATATILTVLCSSLLHCDITEEGIVIELTPDEIQEKLDKAFPVTEKYLMLLELTLADPEVELTDGSERVGFGLSAKTNVSVNKKDVTGRAFVTAGLRYDPEKGALFLADPKVETLKMSMLPEEYEDAVLAAANLAAGKYLKEYELYRLKQSDFKERVAKYALKDVVVRDGVLKLIFGPKNR